MHAARHARDNERWALRCAGPSPVAAPQDLSLLAVFEALVAILRCVCGRRCQQTTKTRSKVWELGRAFSGLGDRQGPQPGRKSDPCGIHTLPSTHLWVPVSGARGGPVARPGPVDCKGCVGLPSSGDLDHRQAAIVNQRACHALAVQSSDWSALLSNTPALKWLPRAPDFMARTALQRHHSHLLCFSGSLTSRPASCYG